MMKNKITEGSIKRNIKNNNNDKKPIKPPPSHGENFYSESKLLKCIKIIKKYRLLCDQFKITRNRFK